MDEVRHEGLPAALLSVHVLSDLQEGLGEKTESSLSWGEHEKMGTDRLPPAVLTGH